MPRKPLPPPYAPETYPKPSRWPIVLIVIGGAVLLIVAAVFAAVYLARLDAFPPPGWSEPTTYGYPPTYGVAAALTMRFRWGRRTRLCDYCDRDATYGVRRSWWRRLHYACPNPHHQRRADEHACSGWPA